MSIKGNDAYLVVYWDSDKYNAAILKIYYSEAIAQKYFNKMYEEMVGHYSHLERLYLFEVPISFLDTYELDESKEPTSHNANLIMNHLYELHIIHENTLD